MVLNNIFGAVTQHSMYQIVLRIIDRGVHKNGYPYQLHFPKIPAITHRLRNPGFGFRTHTPTHAI